MPTRAAADQRPSEPWSSGCRPRCPDYPRAIPTPILVIASGADRVVDTRSVERFATRLRAGSLIVIDGARHEVMFERDELRELFFKAFDAFALGASRSEPAFTSPYRA